MSDNTRRETASTGTPHPARHPFPPRGAAPGRAAVRTVPRPERHQPARGGRWPDARTAEALLAGRGTEPAPPATATPAGPADRLVRLLSAAREVSPTLDPDREAAALAAFRKAAEGRAAAAGADTGTGGRTDSPAGSGVAVAPGGRLGALRGAFAVRRPRVMVAAVASALALGGVAVGMAAARTSPAGGGGSGTSPLVTRPPAAVSPDGGRSSELRTPPGVTTTPARPGADPGRSATPHPGRACGRTANALCPPAAAGNGKRGNGENGSGNGDKEDQGDQGESGDRAGWAGQDARGEQDRAGRSSRFFGDGSANGAFTGGRGGFVPRAGGGTGTWGHARSAW